MAYAPLPAYQVGGLLDFNPLAQGLESLGKGLERRRREEQFNALFQPRAVGEPIEADGWTTTATRPNALMAGIPDAVQNVARAAGPEAGMNMLMRGYETNAQRDLTERQRATQERAQAETERHNRQTERRLDSQIGLAQAQESRARQLLQLEIEGKRADLDSKAVDLQLQRQMLGGVGGGASGVPPAAPAAGAGVPAAAGAAAPAMVTIGTQTMPVDRARSMALYYASRGRGEMAKQIMEMIDSAPGANKEERKARDKEVGEARGKAEAGLPRMESATQTALETIGKIRAHPGREYGLGATGIVPPVPGTAQAGFADLVEQAKGQAFLTAFEALKGGGAITEIEGAKATAAIARLQRARRPEDFETALKDIETELQRGLALARQRAGKPASPAAAPAAASAIPTGAVDMLRKDPALAEQFDAKYGPGSATRALGGS